MLAVGGRLETSRDHSAARWLEAGPSHCLMEYRLSGVALISNSPPRPGQMAGRRSCFGSREDPAADAALSPAWGEEPSPDSHLKQS